MRSSYSIDLFASGEKRRTINVSASRYVIGDDQQADCSLDHLKVKKIVVATRDANNRISVRLGGLAEVKVNGHQPSTPSVVLQEGDVLAFGEYRLVFRDFNACRKASSSVEIAANPGDAFEFEYGARAVGRESWEDNVYRAELIVDGVLPESMIAHRLFKTIHHMPEQPLRNGRRGFRGWSKGHGFPDALLLGLGDALKGFSRRRIIIETKKRPLSTLLSIEIATPEPSSIVPSHPGSLTQFSNGFKALDKARALAASLYANAFRLALEGRSFRDHSTRLIEIASGEPNKDALREFFERLDKVGEWANVRSERRGHSAHFYFQLQHGESKASLKCDFTKEFEIFDCVFDAEFTTAAPSLTLSHEGKGILSALRALFEIEVGDKGLDDAFIIRGDVNAKPLLLTHKERLLSLAGKDTSFEFSAKTMRYASSLTRWAVAPTLGKILSFWKLENDRRVDQT